jgi:hypothetical protein
MPTLNFSNEQVVELVKQLPIEQQINILSFLLTQHWGKWELLSRYGNNQARLIAQEHGFDWDKMTGEEREDFINNVVYEN